MDYAAQIEEAMLRRGYLVYSQGGHIYFDTMPYNGSIYSTDYELFRRTVEPVLAEAGPADTTVNVYDLESQTLAEIPAEPEAVDRVCRALLADRISEHVRGVISLENCHKDLKSWESFKACKYGISVPVSALDPGLALLVKVLPWFGVATRMSCQGHQLKNGVHYSNYPMIEFMGPYHAGWAEAVLKTVCPDILSDYEWMFPRRDEILFCGPRSGLYFFGGCATAEKHERSLEGVYLAARRLMEPGYSEELLAFRATLDDELEVQHPEMIIHRIEMQFHRYKMERGGFNPRDLRQAE